jgi:hypothetical protein
VGARTPAYRGPRPHTPCPPHDDPVSLPAGREGGPPPADGCLCLRLVSGERDAPVLAVKVPPAGLPRDPPSGQIHPDGSARPRAPASIEVKGGWWVVSHTPDA